MNKKNQIILDTDIGIDIDDTWALGFLLQCQELDLKLVTVGTGDVEYRVKIVAKFLDNAGSNIPVGIGIPSNCEARPQMDWVKDYDLSSYCGTVYRDGVDVMIDTINNFEEKTTIICIGPLTNIGEALQRCPEIAQKAEIISMLGSINKGLEGKEGKIAEWNVEQNIPAAQKVFSGQWPIDITPLDTCGRIKLRSTDYARVLESENKIPQLIMQNYKVWDDFYGYDKFKKESSILFDTVAVYMAYCHDYLVMESRKLKIDDKGYMLDDNDGKEVKCALKWQDQKSFENVLVDRLIKS